jgi:tetratricopeptide (TPR) repeat protein
MNEMIKCIEMANSLTAQCEYEKARTAIRNCAGYGSITDESAPLYLAEINSMLAEGDFANAADLLQKVDRSDTGVLTKLYCLSYSAQVQQALGNFDDALLAVDNAERMASGDAREVNDDILCNIMARRGYILCSLERWPEALSTLVRAKRMDVAGDDGVSIGLHIAYCLQALHRNEDAIQELNLLLEKHKDLTSALTSHIYFRKGAVLLEMERFGDAYRAFLSAENGHVGEFEVAIQEGKRRAAVRMLEG